MIKINQINQKILKSYFIKLYISLGCTNPEGGKAMSQLDIMTESKAVKTEIENDKAREDYSESEEQSPEVLTIEPEEKQIQIEPQPDTGLDLGLLMDLE